MKGSERQILKIVAELKEANGEVIARKIGVSVEYVTEICRNLVTDGYLAENSNGKYKLTSQAQRAISSVKTTGPIGVLKGGG